MYCWLGGAQADSDVLHAYQGSINAYQLLEKHSLILQYMPARLSNVLHEWLQAGKAPAKGAREDASMTSMPHAGRSVLGCHTQCTPSSMTWPGRFVLICP